MDSPNHRNWVELPRDITASILSRLYAVEILNTARLVCSTWRSICRDPSVWRTIHMDNIDLFYWELDYDPEIMCRCAVGRSCGGLLDISIDYFATDHLLEYIAQRSRCVKQVRLAFCNQISDDGLREAITKFQLLEELAIICGPSPSATTLQVLGQSCPLLRSLKLNQMQFPHSECNELALAIANNMPRLRHLEIIGNKLTDEGLKAILDGCPHLQSLDLRRCFNVRADQHLWERCVSQIKVLQHPRDPIYIIEKDYTLNSDLYSD